MIYQGKAKYPVNEVVLHTAALTTPDQFFKHFDTAEKVHDEIDRWHKARGWKGFGYHYGIMPNGEVFKGRDETTIGAHVKKHNRGTIGIVMLNVKRHQGITKFEDYFTKAQRRAAKRLIANIDSRTNLLHVTGHNNYANRECPGFVVISDDWFSWWQTLLNKLKGR